MFSRVPQGQHENSPEIYLWECKAFDEASTAFIDPLSLTIYDPLHSEKKDRFVLIGNSFKNRLLVVVHTERGDNIRIISSRKATKNGALRSLAEIIEKQEKKHREKNIRVD